MGMLLSVKVGDKDKEWEHRNKSGDFSVPYGSTIQDGNIIVIFSGKILMLFPDLIPKSQQFLNNMCGINDGAND